MGIQFVTIALLILSAETCTVMLTLRGHGDGPAAGTLDRVVTAGFGALIALAYVV